jgi:hypothetical protein
MENATAMERLSRKDSSDPVPVWVSLTNDAPLSAEFVMICCPECLRASSQAVGEGLFLIHETGCEYCQTKIRYAVVQALDPLTSQPYHAKLAEVLVPADLLHESELQLLKDCVSA